MPFTTFQSSSYLWPRRVLLSINKQKGQNIKRKPSNNHISPFYHHICFRAMDTPQKKKIEEKVAVKEGEKEKEERLKGKDVQSTNQEKSAGSLPPSSSSSPSHEFSFTISLHPSNCNKPTPTSSSFDIDLSPADDIFFHGHLLPLHLLSHPSISPRSSTSFNDLSLPISNIFHDENLQEKNSKNDNNGSNINSSDAGETKERSKHKSFSLARLAKWRKAFEIGEKWEEKKKMKFEVSRVLKKYAKAVRPFLFFHGGHKGKCEARPQPHSFSGTLNSNLKEWGGRRVGGFSAPASMRTSPSNSGLLVATAAISHSNDSTMEELQNAIQAAIAHCKNSIAVKEEKVQMLKG